MYEDKHKLFLYQLLKNGVLPVTRALHFCRNIKADEVKDVTSLREFASIVNREITKQEFKIVLNTCEVTGQQQVILVNTANDDISKLQNAFSAIQLEFFQKILQEIVQLAEKKLPYNQCLNLSLKLTGKVSQSDAEKLVEKWARMGYLVKHDSNVYLGSRCIIEFTSFFRNHCNDYIQNCNLCSELLFKGEECPSCNKVIHTHCLKKFLMKHSYCPECKEPWRETDEDPIEEDDPGPSRKRRSCQS